MPLPPTERIHVKDEDLRRVQEKLVTFATAVAKVELVHGHLVKDVDLAAGVETKVNHKLGRVPNGFIVVGNAPSANPVLVYETSARTEKFLSISAFYAVLIDIWVF